MHNAGRSTCSIRYMPRGIDELRLDPPRSGRVMCFEKARPANGPIQFVQAAIFDVSSGSCRSELANGVNVEVLRALCKLPSVPPGRAGDPRHPGKKIPRED